MTREIVLDTETTGLDPAEGHRIVEIGALELVNHVPTGRTFQEYVNPGRSMPREAFEVHGIGPDLLEPPMSDARGAVTLADKPPFAAIAEDFTAFIGDARLVIHNAAFDMKFLNAELTAHGRPALDMARAIDTVAIARRRFPGSPANLDALCRRFGIDNSGREKHGALLDSELLAEVYLELIGGRQPDFALAGARRGADARASAGPWRPGPRPRPLPPRLTEADRAAHAAFVETLGPDSLWKRLEG